MRNKFIALGASLIVVGCGQEDNERLNLKAPAPLSEQMEPHRKQEITAPVPPSKKTITQYMLEANDLFLKEDKKLGYDANEPGHTRTMTYNSNVIYKPTKNRESHCVGYTYQVLLEALNQYYKANKTSKIWNMPLAWTKGEPFKRCWYVDGGCEGSRDALVMAKMGTKVTNFSDLRAGDFVNYDRSNRTGHSALFLNFIDKKGTTVSKYNANVVGFKYTSSQGSTSGVASKYAFFEGKCNNDIAARDCGVLRNSLILGRVSSPETFQYVGSKTSASEITSFLETSIAPRMNPKYASDWGSENLK